MKNNLKVNEYDQVRFQFLTTFKAFQNVMLEMHANGEIDVTPKVTFFECLFPYKPCFAHGFAFGACIGMGISIIAYKTKYF